MAKEQGKWFKKFFSSKIFLGILIFAFLFISFTYAKGMYREYKIEQEIDKLKKDISQLEEKKLESMEMLEYVMSDEFIEEKARVELNYKKPGEKVVFFNNSKHDVEYTDNKGQQNSPEKLSNPIKWWYYFTNKNKD